MDGLLDDTNEILKQQMFELENSRSAEVSGLLRLVKTYGQIVDMHQEYAKEFGALKRLLNDETNLPLADIDIEVEKLRKRIFAHETGADLNSVPANDNEVFTNRLMHVGRLLKRVMYILLDDFYPLQGQLKKKAGEIKVNVRPDMSEDEWNEPVRAFLKYLAGLKNKVTQDFESINVAFGALLIETRELEKMLADEFDQEKRQADLKQFENQVGKEVGAIANAFDVPASLDAIKKAVVGRLAKIKQHMAARKQAEMRKTVRAQKKIETLTQKISAVEQDANQMLQKAEQFKREAARDGLTDLYNRKAFDVRLKRALKSLAGTGEQFAVVLFDVNHFKWVNDTFGHVAGDKVLKVIANNLKESFRKNDVIARFGGDEFAVMVMGFNEHKAKERVAGFQKRVSEHRFFSHAQNTNIEISVSAGVAAATKGISANDLLDKADKAMYNEKKGTATPSHINAA
jgi:diguanylate cyclase